MDIYSADMNAINQDEYANAMAQALRFLNYRFLSSYELRRKMQGKEYSDDVINRVEDKLIELQYLDDKRLSEDMARRLMHKQLYGRFYIEQKLKLRGLDIPEILNTYNEIEAGFSMIEKKMPKKTVSDRMTTKKKISRLLANRGFSSNTIAIICDKISASIEDDY